MDEKKDCPDKEPPVTTREAFIWALKKVADAKPPSDERAKRPVQSESKKP